MTPWSPSLPTSATRGGPALALYRDKLEEIQDRIDRLQALQVDLRRRLAELEADIELPAL